MQYSRNPIGIFDSGIGGMTVANAIRQILPNEQIIYFGDTAHLPYGEKSVAAIQAYTVRICNVLLAHQCKVIVIACYTASSAAYELAQEYVGHKAKVLSMVMPVSEYVSQESFQKVGVIATKATVNSQIFEQTFQKLNPKIQLKTLATPLLVTMIEEGFFNNQISHSIIDNYLKNSNLDEIEALILGCTHFPLIQNEIHNYYKDKVKVIDGSFFMAHQIKSYLSSRQLLAETQLAPHRFFVSDYTTSFEASTKLFFGEKVQLEHLKLWE